MLKRAGTVWSNPGTGGDALTLANAILAGPLRVVADATSNKGCKFQLAIELVPSSGDLVVTIGGDLNSPFSTGLDYPYAFFPPDGSGFAVLPFLSGYVVPTAKTNWRAPWPRSREWFGGVDGKREQGWMCLGEPAADLQLATANGTVAGQTRMGGVFRWLGANANQTMTPNRLSYPRKAIFHFFPSGGYVAQAEHFREYAKRHGWFVALKEKAVRNPNLEKVLGGPIIYLWGDGRSEKMLDALKAAGVEKALLQMSINNTDHLGKFPSAEFPDNDGWSKAVRQRGYVPGLSSLLTVGWQVPLWDLVFHDALIVVPHWHAPNNKYVYAWDH